MVVALLSQVKHAQKREQATVLLILALHDSSARNITLHSSSFADVLPALWAYCFEIAIACNGEEGLVDQLKRTLCTSLASPGISLVRPLRFFENLDEAIDHAKNTLPHDVLEMQRRRLRSGSWPIYEAEERKCR